MSNDPYEAGTPKYQTAQDIYDGLKTLVNAAEEIGLLGEIFQDVSWEGSDYYYIDKGCNLLEKFETACDYGNEMWRLDLAVVQMDDSEIHGTIYEALCNVDLAKRIGFKNLFIQTMLCGDKRRYAEIAEAYFEELDGLDRFDRWSMMKTFEEVMAERGENCDKHAYDTLSRDVYKKVRGLNLQKECVLIAECRSLLTAYDDFNYGIHMNHELYKGLEQRYDSKMAALQASYDEKVKRLYLHAERHGIVLESIEEIKLLDAPN